MTFVPYLSLKRWNNVSGGKMLQSGQGLQEIAVETGASSATISRVNRALLYGSDGYKTVLSRLEK